MINSCTITTPKGESITFELRSPEKSGFFIKNIEGLNPPNLILNLSESLYSDGSYLNSMRLAKRNIVFDFGFYNDGLETIEAIRNKSYKFFPLKSKIRININTDSKTVFCDGYVETNEPLIFSKNSGTQISVICPDPYFYGEETLVTMFTGTTSNFQFPFENTSQTIPTMEMGLLFLNTESNVYYVGEIETGVSIYVDFFGSVNNLAIHNATAGQDMTIDSNKIIAITGSDFRVGDTLVLSTKRGNKVAYLVRGGIWYNIVNAFGILTDWFTVTPGDNVFAYTAQSGINNMQFQIHYNPVYGGL